MTHYELPHEHGQNIDKVLEKMPETERFQAVAELFGQISDTTRLRIFWILCHCEECVSNISALVDLSKPLVSHHLALLRKAGVITSRREGKEVYYKISEDAQAKLLHEAIDGMFEITCPNE